MKTSLATLRLLAASALAIALAGCGGSSATNLSLGGTVTGLNTGNLILLNGTSTVNLASNDGSAFNYSFPARINFGAAYSVTIQTQPATLTCSVANAAGVSDTSDITNVNVTCVPNNVLGGTVAGLNGSLTLVNGSDTVTVTATGGNASFAFPRRVGDGAAYGVTILSKPANQTCTVLNGVGTMGTTDINSVQVNCV